MNKGMLELRCQILVQKHVVDRFNPDSINNWDVLIDNVPCTVDTLIAASIGNPVTPGTMMAKGGGLLFIDGDYGRGKTRQFNEKNMIRLDGFDYNIEFVHDIDTSNGLDHYEVELMRRVVGGV